MVWYSAERLKILDPSMIQNLQVLKDEQATAIYGSRGANGVVLISTGGAFQTTNPLNALGADYDQNFMQAAGESSSIRNNFSDYAFWQPRLKTDRQGKVSFPVVFPDDVTSWRTFYLVMNDKKQSGQAEGNIKSYKPLMAQLAVPRFLIENDKVQAIGKILNYTPDTMNVTASFELQEKVISEKNLQIARSFTDILKLVAEGEDSLLLKYYIRKEDGYFDGEQRYITQFPAGLEESSGGFHILNGDTFSCPGS